MCVCVKKHKWYKIWLLTTNSISMNRVVYGECYKIEIKIIKQIEVLLWKTILSRDEHIHRQTDQWMDGRTQRWIQYCPESFNGYDEITNYQFFLFRSNTDQDMNWKFTHAMLSSYGVSTLNSFGDTYKTITDMALLYWDLAVINDDEQPYETLLTGSRPYTVLSCWKLVYHAGNCF